MNKKLIALAVAAAFTAPMAAQAEVTPYGHLQMELGSFDDTNGRGENNTGGDRTGVATDKSALKSKDNKRGRLGFKVSEDLGGGLKAIAKFEWQVDTAHGNVDDGARESWVGLKGGFGEFKMGRIKSPYKYSGGVKYDPFVATYMEARKSGGMSSGTFGHNSFWNTSASYKNKFGPVSLWVTLGLDEGDGGSAAGSDAGNSGDLALGLKYGAKNFEVFVATSSDDDADGDPSTSGSTDTYEATKFGGKMKFGSSTITLQSEAVDNKNVDEDYLFVGYQLKMGKNVIVAQIGQKDSKTDSNDEDYLSVGLIHKFSKKTRAFVGHRTSEKGTGTTADAAVTSVGLRVDF